MPENAGDESAQDQKRGRHAHDGDLITHRRRRAGRLPHRQEPRAENEERDRPVQRDRSERVPRIQKRRVEDVPDDGKGADAAYAPRETPPHPGSGPVAVDKRPEEQARAYEQEPRCGRDRHAARVQGAGRIGIP